MKNFISVIIILFTSLTASKAQVILNGKVYGKGKLPLVGAGISIKGTSQGTFTKSEGQFALNLPDSATTLVISHLGYVTMEVMTASKYLEVELELISNQLQEILVSTGYQKIPPERAAGSYSFVNEENLNRRVSMDVLSRISDMVPGLTFHKGRAPGLRIRGQSTIFADPTPLIVVDNFPFEGDLTSINPNDIESITVLKDAAAASIWGTRAGNGVIVITTKKGQFNTPVRVSVNSNLTIGQEPNMYYQPRMSTEDYINIEKDLFQAGNFRSDEQSINKIALSPVVELLIKNRDGIISDEEVTKKLARFKNHDIRSDYQKYFYRKSANQQYSIDISSGNDFNSIKLSAGHDRQLNSLNKSDQSRTTFGLNNSLKLWSDKLILTSNVYYSEIRRNENGIDRLNMNGNPIYPYAMLSNNDSLLSISHNIRLKFIDYAENLGLLSWKYVPIQELDLANNKVLSTDLRLLGEMNYKILSVINLNLIYQYGHEQVSRDNLYVQESFFARDLINRYTQINSSGKISYKIPLGDILDQQRNRAIYHNLRTQFSYNKKWHSNSEIRGIIGVESRSRSTQINNNRQYGYNSEYASTSLIDYVSTSPSFITGFNSSIPYVDKYSQLYDYNFSYYSNASYSYVNRYLISLSGRIDKSNLFGVETNAKSVPLYSFGASWEFGKEKFYNLKFLPYARLRLTWGYNGNVDKKVSALTTARYGFIDSDLQIPYSQIVNPPNPTLRWERVSIFNTAMDFATLNRKISGTVEFYKKRGIDLIGNTLLPPSSGISNFRGNYAETSGYGIDFNIQSKNLNGKLKWSTEFIISLARDKVLKYDTESSALNYLDGGDNTSGGILPLKGHPLYSVYSFKYKGLDRNTGDPIGYLNGKESQDYATIIATTLPQDLVFHGSASPTWFGSIRNSFKRNGFSISAIITYRGGYYFRRSSIRYGSNVGLSSLHGDYEKRWEKPGDEINTNVPSVPSVPNYSRDNLFLYGGSLVEKGDHIRIKDVEISYSLNSAEYKDLFLRSVKIYAYADNLGIIWKAAKSKLDPDFAYAAYSPVKTFSIGLRADL